MSLSMKMLYCFDHSNEYMELENNEEMDVQRDKIIEQLELLNAKMAKQNSIKHIFTTGIIYGFGVFIGSAVLATIAFGVLSPWFGQIEWVKDNYERGASMQ